MILDAELRPATERQPGESGLAEVMLRTYRVRVDSSIASEVTVSHCSRAPRVGQRFRVGLGDSTLDFGIALEVEEIKDESKVELDGI